VVNAAHSADRPRERQGQAVARLAAPEGPNAAGRRAASLLVGGIALTTSMGVGFARAETLEAERLKPQGLGEITTELVRENIEFDKKNVFSKQLDKFPEEIREEQRELVIKDEYIAAVEINAAFELLRKEFFVYGLLSFFPALAFYLKKKKEYDEEVQQMQDLYKFKPGSKGYIDPKNKKNDEANSGKK